MKELCGKIAPPRTCIGERLSILGVEIRGAAGDLAVPTHLVKHVPNGESLADVRIRVQFAARIERLPALGDNLGSQRNVRRNHEVARTNQFNNPAIGHVHARRHEHAARGQRKIRSPLQINWPVNRPGWPWPRREWTSDCSSTHVRTNHSNGTPRCQIFLAIFDQVSPSAELKMHTNV